MHDPLPLLGPSSFPAIRRARLDTVQVNLGYRCNQSCVHCHVNAGPTRTEEMTLETAEQVIDYLRTSGASTLDITGGAPELNESFRPLVRAASDLGVGIIDRCNLTILEEPGHEDLAEFLAQHGVRVVASLPCYQVENVARQRGKGVFETSIAAIRRLNRLGYAQPDTGLTLDLVFNPQGADLPPPQAVLEKTYKQVLAEEHRVHFDQLLTITNMPVGRFASVLISKREFHPYIGVLKQSHVPENIDGVMCRSLVSIDWQGFVYDCDFNQMLGLPARHNGATRSHVSELGTVNLEGAPIAVRDHCFGCTAGQGSSCGGAFN